MVSWSTDHHGPLTTSEVTSPVGPVRVETSWLSTGTETSTQTAYTPPDAIVQFMNTLTLEQSQSYLPTELHFLFVFLLQCVEALRFYLYILPLEYIYFNGPSMYGWGGWNGASSHLICSQILQMDATILHQTAGPQVCTAIINHRFGVFVINVTLLLYFFTMVAMVRWLLMYIRWRLRSGRHQENCHSTSSASTETGCEATNEN